MFFRENLLEKKSKYKIAGYRLNNLSRVFKCRISVNICSSRKLVAAISNQKYVIDQLGVRDCVRCLIATLNLGGVKLISVEMSHLEPDRHMFDPFGELCPSAFS